MLKKALDYTKNTGAVYGLLWNKKKSILPLDVWHFTEMQKVIPCQIVRGKLGIDIGSGCGYDTYIMAKNNPLVRILSLDISDGAYKTRELTCGLENVRVMKASVLKMPLKDDIFDFVYSFGVLHHTISPREGLLEICRILKKNSPAFLYLYEDHSENRIKYIAVYLVAVLRIIAKQISPGFVYFLCWLFSPIVFVLFSLPAIFLRKFKPTQDFSGKIPFNFAKGLFSLRGDLYDRFRAPIEHRFSRNEVKVLFRECGFKDVNITRLKSSSGWVVWGNKDRC